MNNIINEAIKLWVDYPNLSYMEAIEIAIRIMGGYQIDYTRNAKDD